MIKLEKGAVLAEKYRICILLHFYIVSPRRCKNMPKNVQGLKCRLYLTVFLHFQDFCMTTFEKDIFWSKNTESAFYYISILVSLRSSENSV